MSNNELLSAALDDVSRGWSVFPLIAKDKRPRTKNGFYDATTDAEVVKATWAKWPDSNVGIVTGEPSGGLLVIDVDVHNDGTDGFDSLAAWERQNGKLPETARAKTGAGGSHIFYYVHEHIKNRTGVLEGVDIRCDGGYIVGPGSIHPNGIRYEWEFDPDEYPIAEADENVLALVNKGKQKTKAESFTVPDKITSGTRNDTIYRLACSLQAKGLSDTAILAACRAENMTRCDPALDDDEVVKIVESALRHDKGTSIKEPDKKTPLVVSVADIQEIDAEWLIEDVMPRGQISIWGGDGGEGKGFVVCDAIAGLTTGRPCLLDMQVVKQGFTDYSQLHVRDPATVLYLSGEDSFEVTLRRRLRKAGADMTRVLTMNFTSQLDANITTGSAALEQVIETYRPDLLVLDPLESFLDESVKMSERNAMRQSLRPLLKYGEQYGLTTLIVAHSNKGKNVWGRKRLADSSDLWDIARSVFLLGRTPDKHRYMSHEKSNYGPLQKTIIFDITPDERVSFVDYSELTDRDYVLAATWDTQGKSTRTDAKDIILDALRQATDPIPVAEIDELAEAIGLSGTTLKRAKTELKKDGVIKFTSTGNGKDKRFYICLV